MRRTGHGLVTQTRDRPNETWPNGARDAWADRRGFPESDDDAVRLAMRGRDPLEAGNPEAAKEFRRVAFAVFDALAGRQDAP